MPVSMIEMDPDDIATIEWLNNLDNLTPEQMKELQALLEAEQLLGIAQEYE